MPCPSIPSPHACATLQRKLPRACNLSAISSMRYWKAAMCIARFRLSNSSGVSALRFAFTCSEAPPQSAFAAAFRGDETEEAAVAMESILGAPTFTGTISMMPYSVTSNV